MIVDDRLYLGMGHDKSWDIEFNWTMDRWEIWSTNDLKTWVKETVIHPNDTYFGPEPNCWAGDFAQKDGKYYWYFSNKFFDTGVMIADKPGGPYKDALGKPLLSKGLAPTNSYDPEVYEENGVYTIIWGAGTYYCATLGEDMLSLADKPQKIEIYNSDGTYRNTDDKPTMFKRNEYYYLVWGAHYAMSKELRGPYDYKGAFYSGGHGSIFNWKGQWYVVHEHHDISMFYRGIMLKTMYFNPDGTVNLKSDFTFPIGGGRKWEFDNSRMGWRSPSGTNVQWTKAGTIKGEITGQKPIIESANWASTETKGKTLEIRIKNNTPTSKLKLSFALFKTNIERFWSYPEINWLEEATINIDVKPNSSEYVKYTLPLDTIENIPKTLKRLRIEFLDSDSGNWEIDYILIQ
ncbi:family 43 glycosylhydrolase [Aquimarina agarivorans]|uniref:family 43 glycosylhydrolase n=1 Tax=Aquimarina agarivorans TaxID=980584 RepID=UPI000248EBF8|nr:family 43 glycosylhydrolase [Aquimarina agarivorans]